MKKLHVAARCEGSTLWVWGTGDDAMALITMGDTEPNQEGLKPLDAVLSHLDLEEWDFTPWKSRDLEGFRNVFGD